jgi:site-specific DNA recombinase
MKVFAVARQSRGDDNSKSVPEQVARLRDWCEREGHELVAVEAEQDVSGGRPLAKRPGLLKAVEAVEEGRADAVAVAYFDRLVRSLTVQAEIVSRVEAAGGKIVTLDVGEVSHAKAASWLSANFLGLVSEYHRRTTKERVRSAHERLVSEGKWVGGKVPIGYELDADGRLAPDENAPAVLDAYHMREGGSSLEEVRRHLREATGLAIPSLNVVQRMLRNPVYLGAVVRDDLANPAAHEAIVPRDLHRRVSGLNAPRGKRPHSDRLLARLGVLKCGTCGSRMTVATATGSQKQRVPVYRCPPGNGCENKQSITATIAEGVVVHAARVALAGVRGRAGGDTRAAEAEAERARQAFTAAVEAFDGFGDAAAVRNKLGTLRAEVEAAEDALERARRAASFTLTTAGESWDELTQDERRGLIHAVVERAEVMPGKGADRVVVTLAPELADAARVLGRAAEVFREDLAQQPKLSVRDISTQGKRRRRVG